MSLLLAVFRARDHRGLDGDREAEDDRRRTRSRAGAQRRMPAERLSCLARNGRKPRGRKSLRRRCGSDDRGAAGLRPDQAIKEATCVRVLNRNLQEKTWRISVVLNKRSVRFGAERETICRKGRYCPGRNDRAPRALHRSYVDQTEIGTACSTAPRRERGYLSLKLDRPLLQRDALCRLARRMMATKPHPLVRGGCENWLRRILHHPGRLRRAGLREHDQAHSTP